MRLLRRRRRPREFDVDTLLWGVQRRRGYGVTDDPRAHRGKTQHAFVVGDDTMALCGFRPTRRLRLRRRLSVPLAMATEYNPRCLRCVARIPFAYSTRSLEGPAAVAAPMARLDQVFPVEPAAPHATEPQVDFDADPEVIPLGPPTAPQPSRRTSRRRRKVRTQRGRLPKAA